MDGCFFTKSQLVGEKSKILCTFRNCFNNYMEVFGRLLRMVLWMYSQTPPSLRATSPNT